ncbi:MAG: helix-turn-helix transcriptional regulator, partial [Actinomycetota bacterium]
MRVREVVEATSLRRSTLWSLEKAWKFPMRMRLSGQRVGWRQDEVVAWLSGRTP